MAENLLSQTMRKFIGSYQEISEEVSLYANNQKHRTSSLEQINTLDKLQKVLGMQNI